MSIRSTQQSTRTPDIHELQQAFDDAKLHADTDRLNALRADDFLSIGERGYLLNSSIAVEVSESTASPAA